LKKKVEGLLIQEVYRGMESSGHEAEAEKEKDDGS
jgi:hypothetical protein